MKKFLWPVVPLCKKQLLDIHKEHILNNGLYRKCYPLSAGGGYDYYAKNINPGVQFVVQLYGCPLNCWYCYVTKEGIFKKPILKSSKDLINDFINSKCDVFHLMGGAPALYIDKWYKLSSQLKDIFHSDLLLIESEYSIEVLNNIDGVHSISLKNEKDVRSFYNIERAKRNRIKIEKSNLKYYYTFTGNRSLPKGFEDVKYFNIPIKNYKAIQ